MGKVIPTANGLNVNLENVASAMALATSKGIATAESTTYLNAMLSELGKSGTKVSDVIKKETGKSFSDLMKEGKSLSDVLGIVQKNAEKNGISLTDMFGSAEAGRMALTLATDDGKQFNSMLSEMSNSAGETEKAFNKMDNTLRSRIDKIIQRVKVSFIQLGEALLPLIEGKILPAVEKFATWLSNLDEKTLENMASWVKWGAILGGVLMVGGKMLTWGSSMVSAFSNISSVIGGTSTVTGILGSNMSLLGGSIALLSNPITLIVGGLALLTGAFISNTNKCREGEKAFAEMGKGIDDFSGKLRTNDSIWSSIFGKTYEFKMSAQFHEQKEGVEKDSEEIVRITQETHNKIEEILNSDISTEEKQKKIKEAHEQEIAQLTEKWNQYNDIDNQNQAKNGQAYMQYLTELGVTDYNFRSEQLARYNEYFDTQQANMQANEDKILDIKQTAYNQNRQLTDEEETQISNLIKENADIRTTLTEQEGKDVWQILDKYNLEKKTLYGQDALNHSQADLDKRKSMEDFLTAKGNAIDEEIKMTKQRTDIDTANKNIILNNLESQKMANNFFKQYYSDNMRKLMESGKSWEQANSEVMKNFATQMENGQIPVSNFKMTTTQAYASVIQKMLETGASADDLTEAIKNIPAEKRAEVLALVDGKDKVDILEQAIARVKSKTVTIKAVTTGGGNLQMNYYKGSEGVPARAYGDESFASTQTALVGEQGAEIVELPQGAKVKTHRETRNTLNNTQNNPPMVAVQIDGRTIATALSKYISESLGQRNRQMGFGGAY